MSPTTKPLGSIEHVIVLMFENRSFDNVLGGLYPGRSDFDGVPSGFYNPVTIDGQKIKIPAWQASDASADIMPFPDPNEDYEDMKSQIDNGTMMGFAENYADALKKHKKAVTEESVKQIMQYYSPLQVGNPGLMPYTTGLAKSYAVSDRYFGSGPVQTWPNRLFAHCGTPGNKGTTSYVNNPEYPDYPLLDGQLPWKTVFELIDEIYSNSPQSWRVYFDGEHPISSFLEYVNKHYNKVEPGGNVSYFETSDESYTDFFKDLAADSLPKYSFIEPRYQAVSLGGLVPPNSNHPGSAYFWESKTPIYVAYGELLLQKIFYALKAKPETFKKTLLIVTYDEHGGLFDHVNPPNAVSPFTQTMSNYNYNSYGPRVPAIFINPYIEPQTILRPSEGQYFDHTSIIATLRDQFNLKGHLTPRDKAAPTFSNLINEGIGSLNFGPDYLPDMNDLLPNEPTKAEDPPKEVSAQEFATLAYSVYYSAFGNPK